MKIAFFEIKPEERVFFEAKIDSHELFFFEGTINDTLITQEAYDVVSIFIHSKITDDILEKLPQLRYLQTRSTGYDHIKCNELYQRGLIISNVAGYGGPAVAEFAFSLLLNASRSTYRALERTQNNNFTYSDLKGIELFDKTVGILGLGTIGSQMARIAKGFGMNVLVYSRTKKPIIEELSLTFCDVDTLLSHSDIIMLALPLTPTTKHILNCKNSKCLNENVIIVNTARGELIEDKLYEKLSNIFCLDVISNQKYIYNENVLYTPHMAYYTEEALERIIEISLNNLEAFLLGKSLPNCLKIACERDYKIKN
jgi:D-lactate dehydrogenase